MSYERKSLQILGGGWNLLPPGDKVPTKDYLLAQNWRVDQLGRLVSRCGYVAKESGVFPITGPAYAHSGGIHGGITGTYYIGAGTDLYCAGASIASGFDGGRIGFAPMNGFMWAMNRGKRGKHNGGGWKNWNSLTRPGSACSAIPETIDIVGSVDITFTVHGGSFAHTVTIHGTTYSVAEGTYVPGEIATTLANIINGESGSPDPYCTASSSGFDAGSTPYTLTITPKVSGMMIPVVSTDSPASVVLGMGAIAITGPNGSYQYYCTFELADETEESNPGPASSPVALNNAPVDLIAIPVSSDPAMAGGNVNIYASGGTLGAATGKAYLVGTVANGTTTFRVTITDLEATNDGVVMQTANDPAPAAAGIIGPYFSRLLAWSTASHPERLYWTDPNLPQYFPGSADDAANGNWVDVGMEGEAIIWCSQHANILMIYKERSIWRLTGDPDTGTLEQMVEGVGLVNAWALAPAGSWDYFVAPTGIRKCNADGLQDFGDAVRPLFTLSSTNDGPLTQPGSIREGKTYDPHAGDCYWIALGYAMGKLYAAYKEKAVGDGDSWLLMVYDERSDRWFYHRSANTDDQGIQGFVFDGLQMVGLTGDGSHATGYNLDNFRDCYPVDAGSEPIECVYQSHYEDCGEPDSEKVWLEVVVDCELAGDTATVYVGLNTGKTVLTSVGTITGSGRQSVSFGLAANGSTGAIERRNPASTTQKDLLARNLSVAIDVPASHPVTLHNVHLYYYTEARLAVSASTIPTDLGLPRVKQAKELMLDIEATGGVTGAIHSDLPGNALALRQSPAISQGGRAILKYPFSVTEGYLWRLSLSGGPFRLYSARLLMRAIGVYVEAYEAAGGFVWDSMEQTFDSGITKIPRMYAIALAALPIKRFREISLEIDTFNQNVTVTFLTDLPGNAQATRFTATVNTGNAGRRFVRLPMAAGLSAPIEGRMCRVQISGSQKFVLYEAAVENLAVGVYIESYEGSAGAVFDSRELDFGSRKPKEARELELDVETNGSITATLYADLPGYTMAQVFQTAGVATTGRQKLRLPLTVIPGTLYPIGRMYRLIVSGANPYRLYGAALLGREIGCYLTGDEASAGPAAVWDSTPLDLGTERMKAFKKLELELQTDGTVTISVYTDRGGSVPTVEYATTANTSGTRKTLVIPLTPGVRGRLVQVMVSGAGVRLYAGRIWWRPLNEPEAGWTWAPLPIPPTPPEWAWLPFPVNPTEPQWFWAKVLSVEETPDTWSWVDVPFEVQGT